MFIFHQEFTWNIEIHVSYILEENSSKMTRMRNEKNPPEQEVNRVVLIASGFISISFTLPMTFYLNADAYWKYKWRVIEGSHQGFDLSK